MPASSDRPETMTKALPRSEDTRGVVAAVTLQHITSAARVLRPVPILGSDCAACVQLSPHWCPQHIPGLRTVNPSSLHWGRSAQGPRQRQAQRGTGRPHDHRGQEMSTMNRAVGSHDWHNHRSNYRGHRPDSVVATAVGRRSAVVHDAGRNHEPGVSPGVHTATATVKPRAVCTGTPDRPASRSRVRR